MKEQRNIKSLLASAIEKLEASSTSARIDAEALMCHVLDCNTAYLATWPEKELTPNQVTQFSQLIDQRKTGTPVAYLTGKREFWTLELEVSPATLIPRPETETLVEYVLENFDAEQNLELVDLGTGSGAIALAIASERPHWKITATDISEAALNIAKQNAAKHRISNIEFIHSHWFDALAGKSFNIIISNPPYVASNDPHLSTGDVIFEPEQALSSGHAGMDDIKAIATETARYLKKNGWLVLEHGFDQKKPVYDCLNALGFSPIHQKNDLLNQPRMTAGKLFK